MNIFEATDGGAQIRLLICTDAAKDGVLALLALQRDVPKGVYELEQLAQNLEAGDAEDFLAAVPGLSRPGWRTFPVTLR